MHLAGEGCKTCVVLSLHPHEDNLCRRNCIERIESSRDLRELRTLNLDKNIIEKIEGLENCEKLDTLLVSHNRLSRWRTSRRNEVPGADYLDIQ